MRKPFLSVIIPAYNEERRIASTLEDVSHYLLSQTWSSEIVVVSDGSVDKTIEVVSSFQAKFPDIKILTYVKNRGKGYAVKQGMLAANGHFRLFMDADSSTPISELAKLMRHIEGAPYGDDSESNSYKVVIGSLAIDGAHIDKKEFFLRVLAGKIGNLLIQWLVLPGIKDTQRGFKLFTAEAAEKIFSQLSIYRWGFDVEVLALARFMDLPLKEVAVRWSYSAGSKIGIFSYLHVLVELGKVHWRMRKGFNKTMTHNDFCQQYLPSDGWLLDIGCGRGKFLCEMARNNKYVYGVETNERYIGEAKVRAASEGLIVTIVQGNAECLPFFDNQFDFVNAAEVTEHIDEPERMLHEIHRVLKPGGKCYISFHNRVGIFDYHYHLPLINFVPRSWTEPVLKFLHKQKSDGQNIGRQKLISMHYYTFKQVYTLLTATGFNTHDIREDKIKQRYGKWRLLVLALYRFIARPIYYNTFHFLLEK